MTDTLDPVRVIDADTHLTEPADLWTARMPRRFRDGAPRVAKDEVTGALRWRIGSRWCSLGGNYSVAGWRELPPSCPPTLAEADPALSFSIPAAFCAMLCSRCASA